MDQSKRNIVISSYCLRLHRRQAREEEETSACLKCCKEPLRDFKILFSGHGFNLFFHPEEV